MHCRVDCERFACHARASQRGSQAKHATVARSGAGFLAVVPSERVRCSVEAPKHPGVTESVNQFCEQTEWCTSKHCLSLVVLTRHGNG